MSELILNDESYQNKHEDNQLSGIGNQSLNNNSNFMVNNSKEQNSFNQQNILVNNDDESHNGLNQQSQNNQFGLESNSGIIIRTQSGFVNNNHQGFSKNSQSFQKGNDQSILKQNYNENYEQNTVNKKQLSKISMKNSEVSKESQKFIIKNSNLSEDPFHQQAISKNRGQYFQENIHSKIRTSSQLSLNKNNVQNINDFHDDLSQRINHQQQPSNQIVYESQSDKQFIQTLVKQNSNQIESKIRSEISNNYENYQINNSDNEKQKDSQINKLHSSIPEDSQMKHKSLIHEKAQKSQIHLDSQIKQKSQLYSHSSIKIQKNEKHSKFETQSKHSSVKSSKQSESINDGNVENIKNSESIKDIDDYKNNFPLNQSNKAPVVIIDSLQYSSDNNPQSNYFKNPLLKINRPQREQMIPTPINSLQEELMKNQRSSLISKEEMKYQRYSKDQSTLILPELKEQSSNFPQIRTRSQNDVIAHVQQVQKVNFQNHIPRQKSQNIDEKTNQNFQKEKIKNYQQIQSLNQNQQTFPTFNQKQLHQNLKNIKINTFQDKQQNSSEKQPQNFQHQIQEEIKRQQYELKSSRKNSNHEIDFHQSENFKNQKQFSNRKRVETEFNQQVQNQYTLKPQKLPNLKHNLETQQQSSIFQTEIYPTNFSLANSKLSKIKQAKQYKKKKLQQELAKISLEIDNLSKKQAEIKKFGPSQKNFSDRLKINNNTEARQKAISLVKNLQKQKKARQLHKISSIDKIDMKISDYMSQLTKMRVQNEKKMKEKKKLQIIERMKSKQIKKMNEIKKIQASSKFVSQFMNNYERRGNRENVVSPGGNRDVVSPQQRRESKLENYDQGLTPQLANKKAYLNRVRNLSQKKNRFHHSNQKNDPYENKLY